MKKVKSIFTALLVLAMVICLCGCTRKTTLRIRVENIGDYSVIEMPKDFVGYSQQINDIIVTVKTEKDYHFVIRNDEGQKYSFTLQYQNGQASIVTNDDISVTISVEK